MGTGKKSRFSALSLLLSVALVWSASPLPAAHGAEGDTAVSNRLTINGDATAWTLEGAATETFTDTDYSFNFWDAGAYQFTLTHELEGLAEGSYSLRVKVYGEEVTNGDSLLFVDADGERHSAAIDYTGSNWGAAGGKTIALDGIAVGADGHAVIGFAIDGLAGHWGHLYEVTFVPELPEGSVERIALAPSSINLRPGKSLELKAAVLPEDAGNKEVIYSSSNEGVATVSEAGIVTAVGNGNAVITATAVDGSGTTGSMQLTVSATAQDYSDATVQVQPIPELQDGQRDDFIMGVDISTVYEIEQSGRKYYGLDGIEKPLMEIVKENGANWIRLRLWNDPKDENGVWYGAGNTDKERVIAMAQQAKTAGLQVLIDFHYSDFWADPGHQHKPKAWRSLTDVELQQAVYDYTYDVIESLHEAGAYPDMVQIGNEINSGMLNPSGNSVTKAKPFIAKGIQAVRDAETDLSGDRIKIMLHRANPEHGVSTVKSFFSTYADLDYDVIGLSYYPFWHGSFDNIRAVMNTLAGDLNKEVVIAETSYAFTLESDPKNGIGNIFGPAQEAAGGYAASVAGQATVIRDVIAAVAEVPDGKGLGIFYWEPAWLPGVDTGWASVEGAAYTNVTIAGPEGSGWSNQAMFNFYGEALPSIKVFELVRQPDEEYEAPTIQSVAPIAVTTSEGVFVPLPGQVPALYSDGKYRMVAVSAWSPSSYNYNAAGTYSSTGTLSAGGTVTANITVTPKNYVQNPGLESSDMSAWELHNASRTAEAPYTGTYAIHFWDRDLITVKQTIENLPDGAYRLSMHSRIGGDPIGESYMYAKTEEDDIRTPLTMSGWSDWNLNRIAEIEVQGGVLEIGAVVNSSINAGGDFDDWELIRIGDLESTGPGGPTGPIGPSRPVNPVPPTVSNEVEQGRIQAGSQRNEENGVAASSVSAEELEKALPGGDGKRTIVIELQGHELGRAYSLDLPLSALTKAGSDVQYVIVTPFGTVTLPGHMINLDRGGTESDRITIHIAAAANEGFAPSIHDAIGNRPIVDVKLLLNGEEIDWSNPAAPVTVSIPYTADDSEDGHIAVWYIDEEGRASAVPNARYLAEEGRVVFSTTHFSLYAVVRTKRSFTDMAGFDWANEAAAALAAGEVLKGVGGDRFAPAAQVTRADYAVMLVRALGLSADWSGTVFEDVAAGAYYYEAVTIANALGIAEGTGNGRFEPGSAITREQMMAMTARALRAAERLSGEADRTALAAFRDSGELAPYAASDAAALVQAGIIVGKGEGASLIDPRGTATRAEAAVIVYRAMYYIE